MQQLLRALYFSVGSAHRNSGVRRRRGRRRGGQAPVRPTDPVRVVASQEDGTEAPEGEAREDRPTEGVQ